MYLELVKNKFPSVNPLEQQYWKALWRMKVHERLKVLLWRIIWDTLPTRCRLAERIGSRRENDLDCVLCGAEMESTYHLFLVCPVSRIIWRESPWPMDITVFSEAPLIDWIRLIILPRADWLPPEEHHHFQLFALNMLDIVWMARNTIVHEGGTIEVLELIRKIRNLSVEHLQAWQQVSGVQQPVHWQPPPLGFIKLIFDVAVHEEFAVGAAVLRNDQGNVVGAVVKKLSTTDPLEGELLAAEIGIKEAGRQGIKRLLVEGDSLLAIKAFSSYPRRESWMHFNLIADIHFGLDSFGPCSFCFVLRDANRVAHHFARWAAATLMSGGHPDICEHFPEFIWTFAELIPH